MSENYGNIADILPTLERSFGDRLSTAQALREQHGDDLSWHDAALPDAVVFPESTDEIIELVKLCGQHKIPIIAYGAGTSLEGHIHAAQGGISLDLSRMNAILRVSPEDMDVTVQAGVTRKQLNSDLRDTGLFFPIDPGADATIGGMAATRASGTNAVRYGTISENILNVTAVLPNGEIVKTGRRARKSSAGYDLTHLLIGSEGTLGIITEVTLRLHGIPEAVVGGTCHFPDIGCACEAAMMTIQSGIPVARIELVDAAQIKASNSYSNLSLPETPALFVEFHGSPASVAEQAELFKEIAAMHNGEAYRSADTPEEREILWKARHDALWAAKGVRPGARMIITDICVPISRLAEAVTQTHEDLKRLNLIAPLVGHVGDGNFHLFLLIDESDKDECARAQELLDRLVKRAHAMDGTCTGEHGLGKGKRKYMEAEHGKEAVQLMNRLKSLIDPDNLFNPQ